MPSPHNIYSFEQITIFIFSKHASLQGTSMKSNNPMNIYAETSGFLHFLNLLD